MVSRPDGTVAFESRAEQGLSIDHVNLREKERFMNGEKVGTLSAGHPLYRKPGEGALRALWVGKAQRSEGWRTTGCVQVGASCRLLVQITYALLQCLATASPSHPVGEPGWFRLYAKPLWAPLWTHVPELPAWVPLNASS